MLIQANETGKCPHCWISNRFEEVPVGNNRNSTISETTLYANGYWKELRFCKCTNCGDVIVFLENRMIYPLSTSRLNAPKEVPLPIAQDFNEACLVEAFSNKAAAALARRCLQNMLYHQWIKKKDLSQEIDEAMKSLPSHLSEAIDAIRNIWNFWAHPMKFQNTWDIVEVEPWETEWILDVLEQLFDFYFVQPALTKAKKIALDAKLKDLWKKPTK